MTRLIYPAAIGLALCAGETISTDYTHGKALRIEVESTYSMETERSMERDGEPVESRRGGGGPTVDTRTIVMIDEVLEHEDDRPTKVRREFEELGGTMTMTRRDEEIENERECPLEGVTLEMQLEDGDVVTEVVDGDEPDDDALLEGHYLTLSLDALLPEDDVDPGDDWDIEGEALLRALCIDVEPQLFPRPERPEREEGGERGRGRGQRGGSRGGGGGLRAFFENGDWDGKATLGDDTEEHGDVVCHVITIEAECSGELPEQERGDRGGGRGGGGMAAPTTLPIPENSFEVELEGTLYFSVADQRPVYFEIEGTVSTESLREMERGDSTFSISSTGEGTFKYTIEINVASTDDE